MKVVELQDDLKKRKLNRIGKKGELQERLRAFIALAFEHGEYEEEKEEDVEERDGSKRAFKSTSGKRTRL